MKLGATLNTVRPEANYRALVRRLIERNPTLSQDDLRAVFIEEAQLSDDYLVSALGYAFDNAWIAITARQRTLERAPERSQEEEQSDRNFIAGLYRLVSGMFPRELQQMSDKLAALAVRLDPNKTVGEQITEETFTRLMK